ncbi:MAG: hypothetical protein MZV70_67240 [Desulfobacterales bacterium]|nr:hypothetical protein [Desulfobacterales bacterium]
MDRPGRRLGGLAADQRPAVASGMATLTASENPPARRPGCRTGPDAGIGAEKARRRRANPPSMSSRMARGAAG